jgi:Na+/melibiose symporter-like transporter
LTSNPAWRHRRRIIYTTVTVALAMLIVGGLDQTDRQVSSQLVIGAVTLLSIIITAYTGFATLDDHWQKAADEPELSDLNQADRSTDGGSMADHPGGESGH